MLTAFTPSIQTPIGTSLALRLKRPLVQLMVLTALCLPLVTGSQSQAHEGQAFGPQVSISEQPVIAQQVTDEASAFPAPGRYLFGQVPERDQLGQGYIVLESTGDQVFGALYYPSSSFDCFHGQVESGQLAMTITNSYTQETYPYSIALASDTAVASAAATDSLQPFNLQGFHQIDDLNDNDLRLLATCQAAVTPGP